MSSDDLFRVKGGVSKEGASVELAVGTELPGVIARLFPKTWARARVHQAITNRIVDKIATNETLDFADAQFLSEIRGEAEARWARRKEIAGRAEKALPEVSQKLLAAAPTTPTPTTPSGANPQEVKTADDWIDKFWDDAELVSDDLLQEIYGRILASEATKPGSCSMRTLKVLRYLDRATAQQFAAIAPFVIDRGWLPHDQEFAEKFGISYQLILDLDDAGLIDSGGMINKTFERDRVFFRWGNTVLRVSDMKGTALTIFPLRIPGRELSRISQVARDPKYLDWLVSWMRKKKAGVEFASAQLPSPDWEGAENALSWTLHSPRSEAEQPAG